MNVVITTTTSDPFAGVFWKAYRDNGGPVPSALFLLPPRRYRSRLQALIEPVFLFGVMPSLCVFAAHYLRIACTSKHRQLGLSTTPKAVFQEDGTQFRCVASLNRAPGLALLRETSPDFLISVGSSEIFNSQVLAVPKVASLNVHNGRLPAYRGLFGTFWEVYNRESEGFVTIHSMVPKVDAGHVLISKPIRLQYPLSFFSLMLAKKALGGKLLAQVLKNHEEYRANLPGSPPTLAQQASGYYRWPSLGQLVTFVRNTRLG